MARAVAVAGLLALLLAPAAAALQATDLAGELNGEAVTLAEIDAVLGGSIRRDWRRIDNIVRTSAREICVARALERLAVAAGGDEIGWRARLWAASRPGEEAIDGFLAQTPPPPGADGRALARHSLRVRSYRRAVRAAVDAELADSFALQLPPPPALPPAGEIALPPIAAECFGRDVTRADVERFAAFPLFRRRGEIVAAACRQLEIDYTNDLLLRRAAAAEGLTVEEWLRAAEAPPTAPDEERVKAIAVERYGRADPQSLAKVRIALVASRRADARLAAIRAVVTAATGSCRLERPDPPVVQLPDDESSTALRVVYFGGFGCRFCREGWQSLERLRRRWGDRIRIELRHHFPDAALPAFDDALRAECSLRQGKLQAYATWRLAPGWTGGVSPAVPGIDGAVFHTCVADPRTAAKVLDDAEESLRLGFGDGIPSWLIGRRPRRGFQGDAVLDATIAAERNAAGE